jgi:hypothetical protein
MWVMSLLTPLAVMAAPPIYLDSPFAPQYPPRYQQPPRAARPQDAPPRDGPRGYYDLPPRSSDAPPRYQEAAPRYRDYSQRPQEGPPRFREAPPDSANAGMGFWASGDFLLAFMQRTTLPFMATTSPVGTSQINAGVLGGPTTDLLSGAQLGDLRVGLRMDVGYKLNSEYGVEMGFTLLEGQELNFATSSDQNPILARPYRNALSNREEAILIGFPGQSAGLLSFRLGSDNFYEMHFDISQKVVNIGNVSVEALGGYRFYTYREILNANQTISPLGGGFIPGTTIQSTDEFRSRNEFHGLDLGIRTRLEFESLSIGLLAKFAIGQRRGQIDVTGNTITTVPGSPVSVLSGGFFALQPNIGPKADKEWSIFPEFGINASYRVMQNVELRLGYNLFVLDRIIRVADQLNTNINPELFPPAQPTATLQPSQQFKRTDPWIQALSLGVTFNF